MNAAYVFATDVVALVVDNFSVGKFWLFAGIGLAYEYGLSYDWLLCHKTSTSKGNSQILK